ncbi:hypothetical protein E3N88_00694 [Mikania micrantha]|uniref:Aminotransferase-like plant mobile domain-containing protein n=1 Tax=Mikania micrantha TaxID=192012 RepID=A0A5N6Q156_9ASTR|nr:hypothetical protein E3N88_00694 [Mikania micrantha]
MNLATRSELEKISNRLEDPVSNASLALNSQGELSLSYLVPWDEDPSNSECLATLNGDLVQLVHTLSGKNTKATVYCHCEWRIQRKRTKGSPLGMAISIEILSFADMDAHFTYGPLNNDLLWLSGSHRGDYYFQNPDRDDGILRIRRGDQDFWKHLKSHPIPENVMEFITLAGFGGIVQCGNRRLDRALISALVERWRPETHTFHLPIGETTITLQDVNILWGLPIEGNVVSGVELNLNNSQITTLFENLVGEELPQEAHIEGWVTQMMHFRDARLRTNGPSGLRWTILPLEFRDILILKESKFTAVYANGTHELYPPWWEVDYIYIPLCIRNVGDWYLVRINLQTMELVQYWPNKGYIKDYRSLIHFPTIDVKPIKFDWLLDEIQYWRKYDGVYIDKRDRHLKVHNVNDDYAPKDGGDLGGDTGVLACMLMQQLVQNKNLNVDDDFKNKCMKYRRYMAKQYYNWRFIPRG